MGTSRNDASPSTPAWRVTNAVLGNTAVEADRQSLEVWRAASSDPSVALEDSLAHPVIAEACKIAGTASSIPAALSSFEQVLARTRAASLQIDLAQRAMVRSVAGGPDTGRFAAELFAEVASYYVSRDLPSHVAAHGRVPNTSSAIALKDQVRAIAREAALAAGPVRHTQQEWRTYVGLVLRKLRGSE